MTTQRIMPGDAVEARDAFGEWKPGVAVSEVEGIWTYENGHARKVHDFPVIWVAFDSGRVPWPAEDVRLAADYRESGERKEEPR